MLHVIIAVGIILVLLRFSYEIGKEEGYDMGYLDGYDSARRWWKK